PIPCGIVVWMPSAILAANFSRRVHSLTLFCGSLYEISQESLDFNWRFGRNIYDSQVGGVITSETAKLGVPLCNACDWWRCFRPWRFYLVCVLQAHKLPIKLCVRSLPCTTPTMDG